jgi:hypothetical protein
MNPATPQESEPGSSSAVHLWVRWLIRAVVALGVLAIAAVAVIAWQRRPPAAMPPIRWRLDLANLQPNLGAITRDGTLITGSGDVVTAIDRDGKVLWNFTNGLSLGSVAVGSNTDLYFAGYRQGTRRLVCLDSSGRFRWDQRAVVIDGYPPVLASDGTVLTSGTDRELHAFSPDGKPLWTFDISSATYGPPLSRPDGTSIVLGPIPGVGLRLVGPDGKSRGAFSTHRFTNEPNLRQATLGPDGTLYLAGSGAEFLRAVTPGGPVRWTVELALDAASRPIVDSSGRIILTAKNSRTEHFEVLAISPKGSVEWRRDLGVSYADSSPALGTEGSIFLTSGEPALWCLKSDGTVRWKYRLPRPIQWVKLQRNSLASWSLFIRELFRTPRAIAHTPPWVAPDGSIRVGLAGAQGYLLSIERPVP